MTRPAHLAAATSVLLAASGIVAAFEGQPLHGITLTVAALSPAYLAAAWYSDPIEARNPP